VKVHHLVVTRLNLRPWKGTRRDQHLDPTWLEARLELFEAITVPCMRAQTAGTFDWHLLIDPATPEAVRQRLRRSDTRIRLVEVSGIGLEHDGPRQVTHRLARESFEQHRPDMLLQSRIDTDDGIRADYFERLRRAIRPGRTEFLSFPHGYQLDVARRCATQHTWPSNSLMNLAQPPSAVPIGIHDAEHTQVQRVAGLRHLPRHRMWLHVIHGANVSSKLGTGRPVATGPLLATFPVDADLVRPRSRREVVRGLATWARSSLSPNAPQNRWRLEELRRLLPPSVRARLRNRRRAARLSGVVEQLRRLRPEQYSEDLLGSLLDAWGVGGRLPSTAFLLELVAAARDGGTLVECGSGPSTLLLQLTAPTVFTTVEPSASRRTEMLALLRRLDLEPDPSRLIADAAELAACVEVLAVNSAENPDARDGYDLVGGTVSRVRAGGTLLFDDARRALELRTASIGPLAARHRSVVTYAVPKPFAHAPLSDGRGAPEVGV
jgi:hypothetical protein